MHLPIDLVHGLLDCAAEVALSNLEADGYVARVIFPINVVGTVANFYFRQLRERDALAGRGEEPNVLDGFSAVAIRFLVTDSQIVDLLALQNLTHSVPTHGGRNSVLHVGNIDPKSGCLRAVNSDIEIRLPDVAKKTEIFHASYIRHDVLDLFTLFFENSQIRPEKFGGKSAFGTGKGLVDVVFDGLREIPENTWEF